MAAIGGIVPASSRRDVRHDGMAGYRRPPRVTMIRILVTERDRPAIAPAVICRRHPLDHASEVSALPS